MKKAIYLLAIGMIYQLIGCANGQNQNSKNRLSASEFSIAIQAEKNAQIIDVRTPEEFSKGHLENALNADWNGSNFEQIIAPLDKKRTVFIYCLSGGRSSSAAEQLRKNGFEKVLELEGGIMKWRGANLPETTENKAMPMGMSKAQFEELLVSDKLVLVDFYADWCGPCQKMKPYLAEIAKDMASTVVVIRINADDHQELCKELQIDALPNLRIFKNSKQLWNQTGFVEKKAVIAQLEKF